jgi:hypothetical protein
MIATTFFVGILPTAHASPESNGASFSHIYVTNGTRAVDLVNGGTAWDYGGQAVQLNLTFVNYGLGNPNATFYTTVFLNNTPAYTSSSVEVSNGANYTFYLKANVTGEEFQNFRADLHWNQSSGNDTIVDSASFSVQSVELFFSNITYSYNQVVIGSSTPSTLNLSLVNEGNDVMYNLTMNIIQQSGLKFVNQTINLGDVISGQNVTGTFLMTAPSSLKVGAIAIGVEFSYTDLDGITHYISANVPVNLTATLETTYPIQTAVILALIVAVLLVIAAVVIRRRNSFKKR